VRSRRVAGRGTRAASGGQVGVFLAYACGPGRALIDRELYLPDETWVKDTVRRTAAAVHREADFVSKPELRQGPGVCPARPGLEWLIAATGPGSG
jgi:SRSO17 transposase